MDKKQAARLDQILQFLTDNATGRTVNGLGMLQALKIDESEWTILRAIIKTDQTADLTGLAGNHFIIAANDKGTALLSRGGYSGLWKQEYLNTRYNVRKLQLATMQIIRSWVWFVLFWLSVVAHVLAFTGVL